VECVRGDDFFKFAANFDPNFWRIAHLFLFPFLVSGMESFATEKNPARGILILIENICE
jgi:hypothetical protein